MRKKEYTYHQAITEVTANFEVDIEKNRYLDYQNTALESSTLVVSPKRIHT